MTNRERIALAAILVAVAAFYVLTLRTGHIWADDFAMYIHHAKNLAEGRAYGDTGYIFNPAVPQLGPPAYPPVLPIILAAVYGILGLNFQAMKIVLVVFSMLGLLVTYLLARRYLPHAWACILILLLGLNPAAWDMKDQIISDHVFPLFVYLAILLIRNAYENDKGPSLKQACVVGVVMYLACGTRNLGLVLLPALMVYDLFRQARRTRQWRPSRFAVAACALTVILVAAQSVLLRTAGGNSGLFVFSPIWWIRNTVAYTRSLREFWLNGFSNPLSYLIYLLTAALFVRGVWRTARQRFGILETFILLYLGLLACYIAPGLYRYLLPVIPVYLIYVLTGLRDLTGKLSATLRTVALTAAALIVAVTYVGAYSHENWGPIREGVGDPQFIAMAAYIRNQTSPQSVFVARRPRLLSLETDRSAAIYTLTPNPAEMQAFVDRIGARYALLSEISDVDFESDREDLAPYLKQPGSRWREICRSGPYRLYSR
jgi:4-amino-4-deoxy-L-arabinose transferase-like glycosyltransferase